MIKKILLLLILVIFVVSGCAEKSGKDNLYKSIIQKDKIIVGISFDSKPFGFKDADGQVKGMEADLAREIADRILGSGKKVIFKNVSSQDRLKAVMSGDVDMVISTMTITPQRKKLVDFSVPYFEAGQVICAKKDSKIDTLDDLINKKVIVILGTTGEQNIKRFAPNALIRGYINNSDAINAFKTGSDDAITTDDSLLQGLAMENGDYIILPNKLTKEPYGIAFKKSRGAHLRRNIDDTIKEIKLDGTLENIKSKWSIN